MEAAVDETQLGLEASTEQGENAGPCKKGMDDTRLNVLDNFGIFTVQSHDKTRKRKNRRYHQCRQYFVH